ncbi:type II toxin-antitoxin system VapC family toxin [Nocardia sp. NPDC050175]|uniref:type II toxin-antitoxin system VapC family toxin n=1 Tax=Nocardia sp. NPDC050175 TaxID=3364317 RepID=UPI0037A49AE8
MTEAKHAVGLIDTCVLIDLARLSDNQLPVFVRISTVTLAELGLGVAVARTDLERLRRAEQLQEVESSFKTLPFDSSAARRFTLLAGLVTKIGRSPKPRKFDLMIAAVASAHRLPLYTRNAKDFEGLESVLTIVAV